MPSSISSFERPIPDLPWLRLALVAGLLTAAAAVAWEIHARAAGYAPTLNDTSDFWAEWREQVRPDSIVIIGDSRALFDSDLDALEQGLGRRPVQLALVGSCAYPILENLANDESFHGTVISSLIPALWLAPALHATPAAELCAEGGFPQGHGRSHREALCRHRGRREEDPGSRRQGGLRAIPHER